MGNKKIRKVWLAILSVVVLLAGVFYYSLYQDDIRHHGRLYQSKSRMCTEFATSYLRTIQKVEPEFNDQKWQMGVDVETELYRICLLNLNKEDLKNYSPTALEKYRK